MTKRFFSYVLPSMLAFAFTGFYTIVDGFFVGRNTGDIGLAAINMAFPLAALIQAMGTGIGMGGAIHISICKGRGQKAEEERILGNTLTLLVIASLFMTVFLLVLGPSILRLMGAEGNLLEQCLIYLRIVAMGAVFQLCSTALTPLLRNYEQSMLAMIAMICGFATNIVLDWLMVEVFQWGIGGAALATIIGQAVTIIPCLFYLIKKIRGLKRSDFMLRKEDVSRILNVGISPFGLTMSPSLVLILINKWAVIYGGDTAVAAYAVIAYVTSIIFLLLQGISDGSQPLISRCIGSGELHEAIALRRLAYIFSFITAILTGVGILLSGELIPIVFGASTEVAEMTKEVLPIFVAGFLFVAFCRVTTSYFYATQQNKAAYIMVYGEAVLLAILLITLLPPLFKLQGVWYASTAAQGILAVIGIFLIRKDQLHAKHADTQ